MPYRALTIPLHSLTERVQAHWAAPAGFTAVVAVTGWGQEVTQKAKLSNPSTGGTSCL